MQELKTIDIEITESVFEFEQVGFMYITFMPHSESYIIAIPSINFSCNIKSEEDYTYIRELNIAFKEPSKRILLIQAIKEGIAEFESI